MMIPYSADLHTAAIPFFCWPTITPGSLLCDYIILSYFFVIGFDRSLPQIFLDINKVARQPPAFSETQEAD